MMVIDAWSGYFVELLSRFVCQLTISFHTFLGMTFHVIWPRRDTHFPSMVIFLLLLRKFWIQTWFCNCQQYLGLFTLSLSALQVYMIQDRCWFSQINFFVQYFPQRINILFLSSQFRCHPHTLIRLILFSRCTNKHSLLETFSQPCCNRIFQNCLSHNNPAKRWP